MKVLSYWSSVPRYIRYSKLLTDEEKSLCYLINDYLNEAGYCDLSNEEFATKLNVAERTISNRISNIAKKGFINIYQNQHKHKRFIYLNRPRNITEIETQPNEKDLESNTRKLIESLKKGIVLGEMDVEVLLRRVITSGVLANIKDNSRQYSVDEEQLQFLIEMKQLNKKWDCQISNYSGLDYSKLKAAIFESEFLMKSSNLGLKFLLENADKIIRGDYKSSILYKIEDEKNKNFKGRTYTSEEWNSCYQSIDDIQI